jgi:hypothetical protein
VMHVDSRSIVTHAAVPPAVQKFSGARQPPVTIADNTKALDNIFSRLSDSRNTHKATARTLVRLCASLSMVQVQ